MTVLGGERRYVLAHPDQCSKMSLFPMGHPSARHSSIDWSDPDFALPLALSVHELSTVVLGEHLAAGDGPTETGEISHALIVRRASRRRHRNNAFVLRAASAMAPGS